LLARHCIPSELDAVYGPDPTSFLVFEHLEKQ